MSRKLVLDFFPIMEKYVKHPMYRFLLLLTIACAVGFQSWFILFNNFAVERIDLNGEQIGVISSFREIPGFLTFLIVFILLFLKEHKLAAFSIFILGVGVLLTGFFPSYFGLITTTMIMSFGFHYFETVNKSLTLQNFDKETSPKVFGRLRSLASLTNIGIGIIVFLLMYVFDFFQIFLLVGGLVLCIGFYAMLKKNIGQNVIPQRKKLIFRKKYWLFYFLTFMAGARRQIFVAFAVFLLVEKFNFSVQEIAILFIINNMVNYFLSPFIGKCIVLFGERKVLSLEYFSLIFIFVAYAFVESKLIMAFLYIFDHIFFNFAIAINTYFQKIGDPKDIAPSMAVGFAINHIAAVALPVIGGILWMVNYKIPFIGGAVLSCISLILVQKIRINKTSA